MATVDGGEVRPHVQAFADACQRATGAESYGTYPGHQPSIDLALDIFTPTASRELGDAICDFAIANLDHFGVDYVIYRQHIYNPEISRSWRLMEDRGSPTQNHMDHVHVSFEPTAEATPADPASEPPKPQRKERDMNFVWMTDGGFPGLHLFVAGVLSRWGMLPITCEKLIAAGVPVANNFGDTGEDFVNQFVRRGDDPIPRGLDGETDDQPGYLPYDEATLAKLKALTA